VICSGIVLGTLIWLNLAAYVCQRADDDIWQECRKSDGCVWILGKVCLQVDARTGYITDEWMAKWSPLPGGGYETKKGACDR
jgi:hypothetical protein